MGAGLGVDDRQNWPTKAGRGGGRKDRRTKCRVERQAELENRHQDYIVLYSSPDNRSCMLLMCLSAFVCQILHRTALLN